MDRELLKEAIVLYAEDDILVQESIASMLRRRVNKVFVANNGVEGVELYKEHIDDINLVITDIEMPLMNGIDMIKKIKEIRQKAPVIIITAFSDEEHKTDLADYIIVKPVKKDILFEAMAESIKRFKERS